MATHKPINILEAFAAAPPPLDYVLPNMVAGTVGALVSPGGAGKSMLALQLAAQIAGGPDLLEVGELPTGPVIYLPAEDPPTAIHHRLHALGAHLSAEERQAVADGLLIQPLIGSLPNIMAPEWFDGLKRAAEGRRLMVLDTLRRFHIEEENASGPMAQVIGRMEAIAADMVNPTEVRVLKGTSPADLIVNCAKEEGCDLIIMGSRGQGGVKGFWVP